MFRRTTPRNTPPLPHDDLPDAPAGESLDDAVPETAPPSARTTRTGQLDRVARAAKVSVAVGIAVIAAPFDVRAADSRPHPSHVSAAALSATNADHAEIWQWWNDAQEQPPAELRRTDEPLLDACPVDGSSTFEDSWGWPRSGGRRHEGVDMIAARGTPLVAVRDGFAEFTQSGLGGRAVWLLTDDGDEFYYAHLDAWEGQSRDVLAGDVIGYVGSSGNARGPHLHFETQPGGHVENPFPHMLGACVPPPAPDVNGTAGRVLDEGPSAEATKALRARHSNPDAA